jgi:hypothetical protein
VLGEQLAQVRLVGDAAPRRQIAQAQVKDVEEAALLAPQLHQPLGGRARFAGAHAGREHGRVQGARAGADHAHDLHAPLGQHVERACFERALGDRSR